MKRLMLSAAAAALQTRLLHGGALASTTSVGVEMPCVTVTPPAMSSVSPPVAVKRSVEKKCLFEVDAATVFVQGPA